MKTIFYYLMVLMLILGLSSCSSTFYMLSPDEESKLEMGRKVIEKENDLAYSSLIFEEQSENNFILSLFAYNKSDNTTIFDPSDIYVKYYDSEKNPILPRKDFAIDPEEQIQIVNSDIAEREDAHDVATGLNVIFSLFDTIVDLSDDEDNNTEEVMENVLIFTGNQVNEEISYQNDIEYLKSSRKYWKNEVLRKTELESDEGVEGIIYIPLYPDAKYIKVVIPIGKTLHSYKFKQKAFEK